MVEVVNSKTALLSNYEVFGLLKELQTDQEKNPKKLKGTQQNMATILYEAGKYLEKTPCKYQNPDIIQQFKKAVQPFKLMKSEIFQILNSRPATAVEIALIVEESEERLSEEQVDQLLDIINRILPNPESEFAS